MLVGPSGCGKSTLLRMIAGLEEISGGEIRIGGKRVNDVPPKERDIAMVFQNYALYPHMTVRDNMAFALHAGQDRQGRRSSEGRRAPPRSSALVALLDRYPRQLSGGQRQRVAMGRAIVRDPQVFLFDEPLSNLDAKLRVAMRSEIKELHQRLKTTSIYVTHDQIEAMTMGDKIVVMRDGRIEQIGSPLELYDHPANLFVAGFIGSPAMNFLPGTLRRNGGGGRRRARRRHALAAPLRRRRRRRPAGRSRHAARAPALVDERRHRRRGRRRRADRRRHLRRLPPSTAADSGGGVPRAPRLRARAARSTCMPDLRRAHLFDAGSGQRARGLNQSARLDIEPTTDRRHA